MALPLPPQVLDTLLGSTRYPSEVFLIALALCYAAVLGLLVGLHLSLREITALLREMRDRLPPP